MLKLYLAYTIDTSIDKGKKQLETFKELLSKYNIEIYGAGIGDSPVIDTNSSWILKKAIVAHDLAQIRLCDVFLAVQDITKFHAGTIMEIQYARDLGLLTIFLSLTGKEPHNIFLETLIDKIIYNIEELEDIIKELTNNNNNYKVSNKEYSMKEALGI